jgi:hypothetical protein
MQSTQTAVWSFTHAISSWPNLQARPARQNSLRPAGSSSISSGPSCASTSFCAFVIMQVSLLFQGLDLALPQQPSQELRLSESCCRRPVALLECLGSFRPPAFRQKHRVTDCLQCNDGDEPRLPVVLSQYLLHDRQKLFVIGFELRGAIRNELSNLYVLKMHTPCPYRMDGPYQPAVSRT